ncbi:PREDICTED: valine--tRNA ligase-like isoform X1 [Populus euphratica]|uniref:Valine--tRNA ligase, mitochondrial n=1 Tax=Populus euphratica TaxID=75702 RepID=A0AAJ6XCJ4_POPEU|nr:PREDICTED: valine--tRNA ligase-like isoform X1 [Populus euphratica]XP_011013564.1 PREDICTED: valine--tRNA ligase-like isoform X1 [Populus euphratica]XP_011021991.1 PREDICTED: valine--tRNA ligase-like isoform X1 [Populus euphratica]XP_011021992.1 PREDICTED: valine--tRNA ligase-like isoform X1 [Populus euphratica]
MEATPEQLERKKKKEEKAREKELKKLKASQKEAKFKVQLQSKKKSRREEEEKVVEEEEDYRDSLTPSGQKKRLSAIMPKNYNPSNVEKCWYEWWEASGFFVADANSSKPPFVILLPPPNVTGNLHLGHALTAAIQDTMIRWKRMSGFNALWVPGLDHAGIATQVVVEKKLMRECRSTRHDLGREKFISEVWKWKHEHGGNILQQLRRLGASLDWSRECFTMDEKRSKAVIEEFVRLFKEGLIYRDLRLVHWDCTLRTAISDDEVDKIDIKERKFLNIPGYDKQVEFGVLTSFAYPIEGGLGEIVVSTTRVETMLGDTAIAVHPGDQRYSHLHGKFADHPFNGRKLPIICDAILVDPSFGTGAVKITPAHDQDDFKAGKRHSLEFIVIFTDDGKINDNGGAEFSGMPRFEAREAVKEALKKRGLYRGAENNEMHLGLCSRSNDVVEPMLKPQWFVNCDSLAKQALQAATDGENPKLEFIPKQFLAEWKRWLGNTQDWCISRQLWWGHRIPAWYVTLEDDAEKDFGVYNDHWVVGRNEEEVLAEASQKFSGRKFDISQDPDVLDTWFSSGLFPLSVLGWPDDTDDLRTFYPTSVLETGHDILFFWVARMVMLGIQLGGDVPFRKVFLHPMVRDAHGRKMSKSLGNVIDPLEVIDGISLEGLHKRLEEGNLDQKELVVAKAGQKQDFPNGIAECGTDALRFALVSYTAQSDKINLDIQRVVGYRQWCNKLWNAVRFAMSKFDTDYTAPINFNLETMPFSCKWILSLLNKAISKSVSALDSYELSYAASTVYSWWQYQFCDVFIEAIKPYFAGDDPAFAFERSSAQDTLWVCLDNGLRLLHPFMPFVTEELWQRLPPVSGHTRKESIVTSEYPSAADAWKNEEVEYEMDLIESTVKCLRSLRAEVFEYRKNDRLPAFAFCKMRAVADILTSHNFEILTLAKNLSSIQVLLSGEDAPPAGCAFENVNENLAVYLKAGEKVNAEVELVKMRYKIDEIQKQQERLEKKINAAGYKEKVPLEIQDKDTEKLSKLVQEMELFQKESERLEAEKSL